MPNFYLRSRAWRLGKALADCLSGSFAFRDGLYGEDDFGCAALDYLLCGEETEACIGAGDDDGLASEGKIGIECGLDEDLRVENGWQSAGGKEGHDWRGVSYDESVILSTCVILLCRNWG